MRYTAQQKQASRERILQAAARAFRAQGFDRPSVASIMKDAGLTHGAFYAHFDSKDRLVAEVIRAGFDGVTERFESRFRQAEGDEWLRQWVRGYLSDGHLGQPEAGCPLPTLSAEIARTGPEAIHAYTEVFRERLGRMVNRVDAADDEARRRVLASLSLMVGALMLARALEAPLSEELLVAARGVAEGLLVEGVATTAREAA
ncbi:MAG: TetR/AcrR family transcriptional regulator [Planctomycetota bacterium]